ncbi:MAG TPA: VCBS repeat-containing protein [Myxococcales bacterium]|nr:VCBS repeat-containing protein [Myxococcales bacterium]
MKTTTWVQVGMLAVLVAACGGGAPNPSVGGTTGDLSIGLSSGGTGVNGGISDQMGSTTSSSGGTTGGGVATSDDGGTSFDGGPDGGPPDDASSGTSSAGGSATGGTTTGPSDDGGSGSDVTGSSGGSSGSASSSGGSSGGTTGGIPTVCTIDGQTYPIAASNPQNSCQICIPEVSATAWSSVGDGASCAGGFCEEGTCASGCVVGGTFYPAGTMDPANGCESCDPSASNSAFSPVTGTVACNANGGNYCSAGVCGSYCAVNGALAAAGTFDPANPDECCNLALSSQAWTPGFASSLDTTVTGVTMEPQATCVGDVTGDGIPDVVVPQGATMMILAGTGDGGFLAQTPVSLPTGSNATHCALADFNGDGTLDVALVGGLAVGTVSGSVTVLLNRGSAGFTASTFSSPVGSALVVADLQGPGSRDLVVGGKSGSASGTVLALLNQNRTGSFTAGGSLVLQTKAMPTGLVTGTFDLAAGGVQLAAVDTTDYVSFIVSQNGGKTLSEPASIDVGVAANALAAGDLNADGRLDLAVTAGNDWYPLLNTGGWTFRLGNATPGSGATIGDLNGDGLPDVASVGESPTTGAYEARVFINETPTGATGASFAAEADYGVGPGPASVAFADLDGDGKPDILTTNVGSGLSLWLSVSALLGQCP